MTSDYFRTFARYNRWANQRIYVACAELSDGEYRMPRPAFFKSIHGTLNHLLVGDRIWLARIEGTAPGVVALDQILHADLATLEGARKVTDEKLIELVDGMTEVQLAGDVTYRQIVHPGGERRTPMRFVLGHLFNHQTHHRGQVHDLLTQTVVASPSLDMIGFLRE